MSKLIFTSLCRQLVNLNPIYRQQRNLSSMSIKSGKGGGRSKKPYKPFKLNNPTGIVPTTTKTTHKSSKEIIISSQNQTDQSNDIKLPKTLTTTTRDPDIDTVNNSSKIIKKKRKFANVDDDGLPLLNPKDCLRRVEFASKMLEILEKDPDVLDAIVFSDEGNFNLSTKPKKKSKPDSHDQKTKKSEDLKLRRNGESKPLPQIVWCGMTSQYVIGPYFFNSHVTERSYIKMLKTFVIPQLHSISGTRSARSGGRRSQMNLNQWWFQQDGNPPHRTRKAISYLTQNFGNQLISYGCPLVWPPKSQDLTPLDYFLWNYLKDKLEENYLPHELSTKETFRKGLIQQIDDIDKELLRKVIDQFPERLEKCIDANGERFDFEPNHCSNLY